jgi:nucleoid-associated protein YgaU
VFGAALVAAGAALLQPLGSLVAESYAKIHVAAPAAPMPDAAAAVVQQPQEPVAPAPGSWLLPESELPPPVPLSSTYTPPPAPERLPPTPAGFVGAAPEMNGNYRSTLAVPPPPLLDVQQVDAQPVVAAPAARPAAVAVATPMPSAAGWTGVQPATHVVRDGDDLTGIATRVYGHPAAAAAVWAANRDVLADPNLLPIGAELKLPPPWSVGGPGMGRSDGRAIEPPMAVAVPPQAAPQSWETASGATPAWLTAVPRTESPAPVPPPARSAGGTVRLGPGETLATVAEKLYGDRAAAARIWEANRDRLRSPDLAVAGMELRLP